MKRRYFGTDGVRGKVGSAPITPDFVMKLGQAAGRVLKRPLLRRLRDGRLLRHSGGQQHLRLARPHRSPPP